MDKDKNIKIFLVHLFLEFAKYFPNGKTVLFSISIIFKKLCSVF